MGWSTRLTTVAAVASAAAILNVAAAPAARLPSAPRSVNAEAGARSVEVTWQAPRSAGAAKIDRYKVVRWTAGVPKRDYTVSQRKRSVTLTKLTPGITYSFTVAAHNERGWGKAGKTVKAVPLASDNGTPSAGGDVDGGSNLGGGVVLGTEDGFGTISGPCDLVASELDKPTPSLFGNRLDFQDDPFDDGDAALLTPGGQAIYSSPSAGGSTRLSELFAFEVLARCEGASLLKLETEIVYSQVGSKKTDLLVAIDGSKVGVSVTRAMSVPLEVPYPSETASELLASKLADIQESSQNVAPEDAWVKQILVVVAYSDMHANAIEDAWHGLDGATKADTVVYVVTTDGSDGPLYSN